MTGRCAIVERLPLNSAHLTSKPSVPAFIYGTAWKKGNTADLVYKALSNGFTAIDTAAQPKHYREDLVGQGLRRAIEEKLVKRSDIFVQTKFTSIYGQDPRNMPYKAEWSITEQVKQSIRSSLKNFDCTEESEPEDSQPAYLDSVVLHSPLQTHEDTMEAWTALESFVPHQIHNLGISNTALSQLQPIYEQSKIKPAVVQNRFYADTGFDTDLRSFCKEKDIVYQSFWTLTANPKLTRSAPVQSIATRIGIEPTAALYCCVLGLDDIVILNGTTSEGHMRYDWQALDRVREFIASDPQAWQAEIRRFDDLLQGL